jgi:hypothetical protein
LAKLPRELAVTNINGYNQLCTAAQKYICETTSGRTRIKTFLSFNGYACKCVKSSS